MSLSEPDDPVLSGQRDFEDSKPGLAEDVRTEHGELAHREAALEVWAKGLVERERRLAQREAVVNARAAALQAAAGVKPVWALPASPVADQIRDLIIDTGDDVATVAKGIGVEPEWAAGVLVGDIAEVDLDHIQRLCAGLHCTPYDLWGLGGGQAIAHAYGPELWPRYIEPLEPMSPLGWTERIDGSDVRDSNLASGSDGGDGLGA